MIDLAYAFLRQEGDQAYVVGPVSGRPDSGYLWHYWLPWLAVLDREHLRLRQLDGVVKEGGPFAFPLEFRWECIRWMAQFVQGRPTEFLTPHIPSAVLDAARGGRAIILLFFGHEGRSLSIPNEEDKQFSAYDLILDFVRRSGLSPGAVWFINGNLAGRPEYLSWKRRRVGSENSPDPFETRFIEPFSHLAQATCRENERGSEVKVDWKAVKNADGIFTHQRTHLNVQSRRRNTSVSCRERATNAAPPMLFLCMNRMPRRHRRIIVCHLLRRGFLERSLVSFRDDNAQAIHFAELEMETAWQELQKHQPLTIDCDLPLDFEDYYRNNSAAVNPGEGWPYQHSRFSIVTETQFADEVLFVSEKIWKPIRNGHPFMVVGTPGTLSYIRQLGFRTFMPLIDERYDSIIDDEQRMHALLGVIDTLGKLDDSQWADLLRRAEPIVRHNMCHLRQLRSPFARLLSEIDVRLNRTG